MALATLPGCTLTTEACLAAPTRTGFPQRVSSSVQFRPSLVFGWCPHGEGAAQGPCPLVDTGLFKAGDTDRAQLPTLSWQLGSGPLEDCHRHKQVGGETVSKLGRGLPLALKAQEEKACP